MSNIVKVVKVHKDVMEEWEKAKALEVEAGPGQSEKRQKAIDTYNEILSWDWAKGIPGCDEDEHFNIQTDLVTCLFEMEKYKSVEKMARFYLEAVDRGQAIKNEEEYVILGRKRRMRRELGNSLQLQFDIDQNRDSVKEAINLLKANLSEEKDEEEMIQDRIYLSRCYAHLEKFDRSIFEAKWALKRKKRIGGQEPANVDGTLQIRLDLAHFEFAYGAKKGTTGHIEDAQKHYKESVKHFSEVIKTIRLLPQSSRSPVQEDWLNRSSLLAENIQQLMKTGTSDDSKPMSSNKKSENILEKKNLIKDNKGGAVFSEATELSQKQTVPSSKANSTTSEVAEESWKGDCLTLVGVLLGDEGGAGVSKLEGLTGNNLGEDADTRSRVHPNVMNARSKSPRYKSPQPVDFSDLGHIRGTATTASRAPPKSKRESEMRDEIPDENNLVFHSEMVKGVLNSGLRYANGLLPIIQSGQDPANPQEKRKFKERATTAEGQLSKNPTKDVLSSGPGRKETESKLPSHSGKLSILTSPSTGAELESDEGRAKFAGIASSAKYKPTPHSTTTSRIADTIQSLSPQENERTRRHSFQGSRLKEGEKLEAKIEASRDDEKKCKDDSGIDHKTNIPQEVLKWTGENLTTGLLSQPVISPQAESVVLESDDDETPSTPIRSDVQLFHSKTGATSESDIDPEVKNWMANFKSFKTKLSVNIESAKRIKVAILDTGLDYPGHPYVGKKWSPPIEGKDGRDIEDDGWKDFVDTAQMDPLDEDGHGTHVAGIFLQHAPNAQLYIARIAKSGDSIENDKELADRVIKAIDHARDTWGVHIISMSFGFRLDDQTRDQKERLIKALRKADGDNIIMFAAASNNGNLSSIPFPADDSRVICIGSCDGLGNDVAFNPRIPKGNNFCVLGVDIMSTWPSFDKIVDEKQKKRLQYGSFERKEKSKGKKNSKEKQVEGVSLGLWKCMSGTSFSTPLAAATTVFLLEYFRTNLETALTDSKTESHHDATEKKQDSIARLQRDIEDMFLRMSRKNDNDFRNYIVPWEGRNEEMRKYKKDVAKTMRWLFNID